MITIRKSGARGQADRGWLQSQFTFSFADYHDPNFIGFRELRVMNEDHIAPGQVSVRTPTATWKSSPS